MTADYVVYDDLPWADQQVIHAHAAERASFLLGRQIRAYDDEVLKNPGVSPYLLAATPL